MGGKEKEEDGIMGGLLYKDYILIDRIGRIRLSWILGIVTVLFVILRVLFPGTGKVAEQFLAYSEDGVINLIDLCFFIFLAIFQCFFILFLKHWWIRLRMKRIT